MAVFVDNRGVRLHALDNDRHDAAGVPVLVVPGFAEHADEYRWLLDALGPRRVVVVDVRGRGRSDVPESGYTWEDHVGDVAAVVHDRRLDRPVLVAFSRGSSYALGHALAHPDEVRGLVVGDYFARHAALPDGFADRQLQTEIRGTLVADRMDEHAVRQVFGQAREVPLWDRLPELRCPVLLIRGGRRSALVTDDVAAKWRAALPSVDIALLPDAGHDLWSRDPDAYLAVLRNFLGRVDGAAP
jgi:pimeloyl-ACP methyl ester carboxylesterase